jgi:hypothetical protein
MEFLRLLLQLLKPSLCIDEDGLVAVSPLNLGGIHPWCGLRY